MSRNLRIIIIGVAVLAALGGTVLLLNLFPAAEPAAATAGPTATPVPLTEETYLTVKHVKITLADGDSYDISPVVKDNAASYVVNSPAAGAFPWLAYYVQDTATASFRVTADSVVEENAGSARLAEFGLDKPAARVRLERADGTSVELLIGRQTPTGTHYYAAYTGGTTVYLIRSYTAGRLLRASDDLRDYTLFKTYTAQDAEGNDIEESFSKHFTSLTLSGPGRDTLEIGRYTEDDKPPEGMVRVNAFYLSQPYVSEGQDYQIQTNVLDKILTISVDRPYVKNPADLSEYGLDKPHLLTVGDGQGWKLELEIGSRNSGEEGGRFIRLAGTEYVLLASGDFSFLDQDTFYLRSATVWRAFYNIAYAASVTYEYGGNRRVQALSMPKPDEEFEAASSLDGKDIPEQDARLLYRRVMAISIDGPNGDGLPGEPETTVTLTMQNGDSHILRLYRLTDRRYAVETDGEDMRAYISTEKWNSVTEAIDLIDKGESVPD